MKVCLVSAAYEPYPSGVSEHVRHLALELQTRGHSVHILTTNYARQRPDSLPVTRFGRALVLPGNRSHFTLPVGLRIPSQVKRFLTEEKFDIVHCHGIYPPEIAYYAATASQAPVVVSFHTYRSRQWRLIARLFRAAFRRLRTRVRARIAVSRAGQDWAEAWFPGKYHVIPNGVDTSRFRPDAPVPELLRGSHPTILYVGRLDGRKGLPCLITALKTVRKSVPDVRLLVAGSGPLESRCRSLAARLGLSDRVTLCGRVSNEDLPGYYAGCTVYCSPALSGEALGIVLLEAMASGRPVVASDIAGYNEVITDGKNGRLVPPGDPVALGRCLTSLLASEEERNRLAAAGLERSGDFAWPRVAGRIEDVYHEVLQQ